MKVDGRSALLAATLALALVPATATAAATGSGAHGAAKAAKSKAKGKGGGKSSGSGSKEKSLEAGIVIKLTPPEESLPETNQINLYVPERFRSAGASLPSCTPTTLRSKGPNGCPKDTSIGGGVATGYTILGGQFVVEHLKVWIFNGPGGVILSWVEGRSPVEIEEIVEGKISKPGGFGEEMSFTIPHGLLEPLPGAPGWMQTLDATVSGKSGWLRTTSCPEHPYRLKAELGYLNGQGTSIEATLKCV